MINILQVVASLKKNGTETFIMNVFRGLDRKKFHFDFLVFDDSKDGFYNEIKSLGSNIHRLPARRDGIKEYCRQLDRFFKEHKGEYDVVQLHGMSLTTLLPLHYAKKYGITKRIFHIHGGNCEGLHNKIFHHFNKLRVPQLVTDALACSKIASDWAFQLTGLHSTAKIIHNGIELEKFRFNSDFRKELRHRLNLEDNIKLAIHIGTFNKIKNHKFLLEVFSSLLRHDTSMKLICVGCGKLMEETKKQASYLGITDHVIFYGQSDEVSKLLSAADFMIFPSLHEGLGLVAIEGQVSGLPVFVSEGIPPEAQISNNFHRLGLNKKADFWANYIYDTISKKSDRELKINADVLNYSINNTVSQLEKIYEGK